MLRLLPIAIRTRVRVDYRGVDRRNASDSETSS
jgi:hypothetical protein